MKFLKNILPALWLVLTSASALAAAPVFPPIDESIAKQFKNQPAIDELSK